MSGIKYDDDIEQIYGTGNTAAKGGLLSGNTLQNAAGISSMVSAFAELAGTVSGYWQTSDSADFLRLKADNIGVAAEQTANMLREKLYGDISNSFAGYAARGVDVGSGTPQLNAELTLKEGGEDLQQLKRNAQMQSSALNAQADMMKSGAVWNMWSGMANGISKGALSYGLLFE